MKRIGAVIFISLLVAPPALAGQKPGKPITWERAQQLKAGTEVMVTVRDSPPTKVKLLFADDSVLVTRKPDAPRLAGRVERTLLAIGSTWPDILDHGASVEENSVRVSREGVFDGVQKAADLRDLIQQTPRGDVLGLSEPPHGSHLLRNVLIGVAIAVATPLLILGIGGFWED